MFTKCILCISLHFQAIWMDFNGMKFWKWAYRTRTITATATTVKSDTGISVFQTIDLKNVLLLTSKHNVFFRLVLYSDFVLYSGDVLICWFQNEIFQTFTDNRVYCFGEYSSLLFFFCRWNCTSKRFKWNLNIIAQHNEFRNRHKTNRENIHHLMESVNMKAFQNEHTLTKTVYIFNAMILFVAFVLFVVAVFSMMFFYLKRKNNPYNYWKNIFNFDVQNWFSRSGICDDDSVKKKIRRRRRKKHMDRINSK